MTNTVTITEQNNTVSIVEDAPVVTADPWYQNLKTVPTSSGSATVTAGGTSHTKGAWTEIISSNAAETSALMFRVTNVYQSATNTATLIDVAVGAAGSEVAYAENIAVGGALDIVFVLPVRVAASARIAVRSQAIIASDTATVAIDSFAMGDATTVGTTFDVLGTSTATSAGTNTSTSYTEIVASTSQEYAAIVLVESFSASNGGNEEQTLQVAIGASGVETDIARKYVQLSTNEYITTKPASQSVTQVSVPAGSRLSVKRDSGIRTSSVTIIGVPA